MKPAKMTRQENQLLCRYLDGKLREEEKDALQDLLRNSAVARKKLRMLATVTEGISGREVAPKVTRPSRKTSLIPWAIAAAATIIAFAGWLDRPSTEPESRNADSFLAMLVDEAGAEFTDGNSPDDIRFQRGNYELKAGAIHLRFTNGADVVIKAPASFEISDGFHMRLHHGKIRAVAPESAQGFTVEAPGVDYEDLGTEFAISVDRSTGSSELHVIDGQVDARHPDSNKLISSVTGGQSLQFTGGKPKPTGAPDLDSWPEPGSIGFLRWDRQRAVFGKHDPGLIGYYPFTESKSLQNEAANPVTGTGEIHGARWVTGRWPGKQALLFDRDTDFVTLNIPGEYEELSFATWVKLDRIDHMRNSIFNSDRWDIGDVHWRISRQGGMTLNYKGARITNDPSLKTVPTDQWVHLTGTLSRKTGESCVYINGALAAKRLIQPGSRMIQPGVGRIGNWLKEDGRFDPAPVRALRGKIDEFAIWKRALTEVEIKDLVEKGKPSALWAIESR